MRVKRKLGSQLNVLLTGMAVNGLAHLEEMENDLAQTNLLLEEAIAKLNNSFMQLHESMQEQFKTASQVTANQRNDSVQGERLSELAEKASAHVDSVVTGLQFQDMTSQLIGRVINRINGLRSMLNSFESVGTVLAQQKECGDMAGILEAANEELARQSEELNAQLNRAVRQQHMDGGSVDLF